MFTRLPPQTKILKFLILYQPPANMVDRIRSENVWRNGKYTYYPVLIVGAGVSGIGLGCRLKQVLGFDQFRIFERKTGLGGTWYTNRYPGVACDVPAIAYSFSWYQNPKWTRLHPSGPEIVRYLHDTCAHFGILDKMQLNTDVTDFKWLEDAQEWEVTITQLAPGVGDLTMADRKAKVESEGAERVYLRQEKARAKIVVTAVGGLAEPKQIPDIPGIDTFKGDIVHTAKWDPRVNVSGKDVVIVGTGCSGAQVVPELVKPEHNAKSVTQLLRSPGWVEPNVLPPKGVERWEKVMPKICKVPLMQNFVRLVVFSQIEADWFKFFKMTEGNKKRRVEGEKARIKYMRKSVPEKYYEILTPDYPLFCKRRVIDTGWFASLNNDKVELTSSPLTSVQPDGVTLGPGRNWPAMSKQDSKVPTDERKLHADTLIFANGYSVGATLFQLDMTGRNGQRLHESWEGREGPGAYMGTAVNGFPNFFILFGPNVATGHSSIILQAENQINYALPFIKSIIKGEVNTYEVKREAEDMWTAQIQKELKGTVWAGGCTSWYIGENGWNAASYP